MLTAQVAPELRVSRDVPVESISVLASRQSAVKQAVQAAEALVSPIDVFIAVVMLGHGDRIPAEVFRERLQAQLGLLAVGCMQRGVMQPDFKSFPLEVLHPRAADAIPAEVSRERLQPQLGLLAVGCMQRGVMQPDFKSFPLEVLHPGAVGGLGIRAAMVGGRSPTANRPYPLGGAEPEAGQEGVDLAAGFQGL